MCPLYRAGRGILISGDPKSNSILYTNGRSVIIRYLDNPLKVHVYGEHGYPVTVARYSPTWSPDMLRIVASGDGKGKSFVRAFMWDTGSTVGDFDGHSRRVLSCAFKPTRPFRIVTCGEDFIVNFYEGPPFKFMLSHREHSNFVNCVRFSPDGSKCISVGSDKKGIIYNGKTGEIIGHLSQEDGHASSIYAISWSPDSKQLLTVSADKSAKIWEISENGSGNVIKTLVCPASGGVDDMLVGCLWQNDHLVIVSLGGTIHLFSASDLDKAPVSFSGHLKNVNALTVVQSDPKLILTSSYDGHIFKWTQGQGYKGRLEKKDSSQVKCIAAVEQEVITSGFDDNVRRIPLNGNECGAAEQVDIGSQPKDLSLAIDSPGLALVSTESGVSLLKDLKVVSNINLGFTVTASIIAPDGSEAIVKLNNMLYHTARINCLAWSPNSSLVATGSLDTCVIIYEVGKPASSRITIKGANLGGVYGLAFTDECTLVSAGEDAFVRVWRLAPQ
ncbi:hypothetical protein GH714_005879 [Hevea brasiliensis]|uniref:Uncharacterized protein n=1 Tax=Hevea brasiliensis TaxID=3981 RepID=A0A6A6NFR1_HEVBR|nr:hypothetical protein GH714_005879 [Hevea brasiliensis]